MLPVLTICYILTVLLFDSARVIFCTNMSLNISCNVHDIRILLKPTPMKVNLLDTKQYLRGSHFDWLIHIIC